MKFATKTIHAAQPSEPETGSLIAPIFQTSTYEQESPGQDKGFNYSRTNNPSRQRLEAVLAELEGVQHAAVFASGLAAENAVFQAYLRPGDEIVAFEPFYENYGPDAILSGATPRFVKLRPPDWTFDPDELAAAFGPNTKAIILNTPNNPTGKVFERAEFEKIRDLCLKWNTFAITDEIYEHMLYDGAKHISLATLDGMRDRTITINALSKTYSVTGWRVGWTISPPSLTGAIRKVHDFLTVGAPAPLQEAGAVALGFAEESYTSLAAHYQTRRDMLVEILERHQFTTYKPFGAYYIMTDISAFGFADDMEFARYLVKDVGVAAVPGSSFYKTGAGRTKLRFCSFSKYSRPFFTLMWSHGSTSSIGR